MNSDVVAGFVCPKNARFHCTRCALCCGDTTDRIRHILLSTEDARKISAVTGKSVENFAIEVKGHKPYVYEMKKTTEDRNCVFLQETDCTVYRVRPLVCRFYPFELTATKTGRYRFVGTLECPGMGKGERLERSYFQQLFNRACNQLWKRERQPI